MLQLTVQAGFVVDFGRQPRPGFEVTVDARRLPDFTGAEVIAQTIGGAGRVGWRRTAGFTGALVAESGFASAAACAGSGAAIVEAGFEGQAGVEITQALPPAILVGIDAPVGTTWGLAGNAHLAARIARSGDDGTWGAGLQLGTDIGRSVAEPERGCTVG